MVSEPTMLSSTSLASSGIGTGPGCQAGVDGSTCRLCSGWAYLSANAEWSAATESATTQSVKRKPDLMSLPLVGGWVASMRRIEERLVARDLLRELVAQRRGFRQEVPLHGARVGVRRRFLERVHHKADVLAGGVAHRQQHDELLGIVVGAPPARVEDGDAFRDHVDVVRIVGIADAVRERSREHRVDLLQAGRHAMERDADQ